MEHSSRLETLAKIASVKEFTTIHWGVPITLLRFLERLKPAVEPDICPSAWTLQAEWHINGCDIEIKFTPQQIVMYLRIPPPSYLNHLKFVVELEWEFRSLDEIDDESYGILRKAIEPVDF